MFAHNITITPADYNITLRCNGEIIGRTERALILHEPPLLPVFYIPRDDIKMDMLRPSRHKTTCPFKGEAHYFDIQASGEDFENGAWSYESPKAEATEIKGFIAFYDSVVNIEKD